MTAMTSRELTEQLLKHAISKKRKKPRGIQPANSVGINYLAKLRKMTAEVNEDIKREIIPLLRKVEAEYTADSWLGLLLNAFEMLKRKWLGDGINQVAETIAKTFVREADRMHEKRTAQDFGVNILGTSPELQETLEVFYSANVNLIKTIPAQYLTNVQSIVMNGVGSGSRWEDMRDLLVKEFGVTDRRARLIARDQTAKINGQLTKKRQMSAGFNYFKWDSSGDARVRDSHRAHDKRKTEFGIGVYRWDDPPTGEQGVPVICGTEFQCRCVAIPVSDDEVKEFQGAKKSWSERI